MVTYGDIAKANAAIRTTDIKGKAYAEVNQRVLAFRMVYPDGFIRTEIVSNDNGVCVMRAYVGFYSGNCGPVIIGEGTAYEKEGSSFINKTSYIENCETSAVGRALGMAGFIGDNVGMASYEEVANAQLHQKELETISPVKVKTLMAELNASGIEEETIKRLYNVSGLADLNEKQHTNIINNLEKIKAKQEGMR